MNPSATQLVGGFTSHEALDPPVENVPPLALLPEGVSPWLQGLGLLGMIATLLLAAASLVVRYRRSDLESWVESQVVENKKPLA